MCSQQGGRRLGLSQRSFSSAHRQIGEVNTAHSERQPSEVGKPVNDLGGVGFGVVHVEIERSSHWPLAFTSTVAPFSHSGASSSVTSYSVSSYGGVPAGGVGKGIQYRTP